MRHGWIWQGFVVGTSVAAISVLIAVLRTALPVPNLAPLYLAAVILFAVTWGWWPALAAAILAFLTYSFLFAEPIYTFGIGSPQTWFELLIFLLVAAVTSNLAARERARREEARHRAEEAGLLYAVSRALGGRPLEAALREVAELLRAAFALRGCSILLADPQGKLEPVVTIGSQDGSANVPANWLLAPSRGREPPRRWISICRPGGRRGSGGPDVPLRVGDRTVGLLRLALPPGRPQPQADHLLVAVADQVAAAVERERLRLAADEAELLRRTDELRAALLSSVSHDLRTPLAAIKASAGSLLQRNVAWSDADREAFAAAIEREADRLDRLVRNLLDMSKIESGALRPRREWYDLAELVREVVARLGPLLAEHPVRLVLPDELLPVEIDYLMIDQVLSNLLENAAKYTPPGTPIEVHVTRADGLLRLCVVDSGPGVAPDEQRLIFDRFQRARRHGGSAGFGLGLAVSRGFAEAHGGRLDYSTTAGGGATFCFELPAGQPAPGGWDAASGNLDELIPADEPIRSSTPQPTPGGRR